MDHSCEVVDQTFKNRVWETASTLFLTLKLPTFPTFCKEQHQKSNLNYTPMEASDQKSFETKVSEQVISILIASLCL